MPLTGKHKGTDFRVREGKTSVGSDPGCDIILEDEFISGQHAQVTYERGQLVLTDLASKNGTFVRVDGERTLAHGDYVFMGQQLLRVEIV